MPITGRRCGQPKCLEDHLASRRKTRELPKKEYRTRQVGDRKSEYHPDVGVFLWMAHRLNAEELRLMARGLTCGGLTVLTVLRSRCGVVGDEAGL